MFGKEFSEDERKEILQRTYEQLKSTFVKLVKPDGQKNSPAKTCKDLFTAYPEKPSGNYWIDPNEGDVRDAIFVYCDADYKKTCILPNPTRTPEINYVGEDQEIWLSDISSGVKITYKADSNQIGFLQLLSKQADQNVTYHCKNSVAYFDAERKSYRRGLKLLAWNDAELLGRGNQRLKYEVSLDECKSRENNWGKTIIKYETDKSVRLPIIDIAARDVGKPDQFFWLEIGPACFH